MDVRDSRDGLRRQCELGVMLDGGLSRLGLAEEKAKRTRRNPLFWIDRTLRTVFALPAYLVSLVVGVPVAKVQAYRLAWLLPLLALIVALPGAFEAGRAHTQACVPKT
jgi:hypothetical protein